MFAPALHAVALLGAVLFQSSGATSPLPIRGLHLSAPSAAGVPAFSDFIRQDLAKEGVNTLVVEFDYGFQFKKHPEVAEPGALSLAQVQQIAAACKDAKIHLIPQINLLGHQSWDKTTGALLRSHPEFDETRGKYPGNKGIYCRSYCPNAPGLHDVVFDLIDELADACGADTFHCGMDEVFILADPDCPYCKGKNTADLFAQEVNALHDHLKKTGRKMWMWGDRFIDGRNNGLGEWEASTNGTWEAMNKVPKDIVICDWHYDHAEPTPAYFAMNGLHVVASPWRDADLALKQLSFVESLRNGPNDKIAQNALGVLHTTWCSADDFIAAYKGDTKRNQSVEETVSCFKALFAQIRQQEAGK